MDPEQQKIDETTLPTPPLSPIVSESSETVPESDRLTPERLQKISAPVISETTPIQVLPTEEASEVIPTFDPKLLASNLEDSWSDEKPESAQLFHQPLQIDKATEEAQAPVQVVEKVVYEKQRFHGFFRTLTLITLLFTGVLMLLEGLNIFSLSIGTLDINIFYPIFVILSVIVIWSYKGIFGKIFGLLMFLSVVAGFFVLGVYSSLTPSSVNATGSLNSVVLSGAPYSKIYLSTLINSLDVTAQTGDALLISQYDTERSLLLNSGQVQSGHNYIILGESDKVNLLERVYTHLQIGIKQNEPVYLYNKTLLGQNTIDLTHLDVRGLRLHGAAVSRNITLGSGGSALMPVNTPVAHTGTASVASGSNKNLSGTIVSLTIESGNVASSGTNTTPSSLPTVPQKPKMIDLDLQAAIADVTIHLPKDMGVRIHYKSYIGKTDFPGFIEKDKGMYESSNIDKATSIVDINAVFGLSRFTIVQDR